MGDSGKSVKHGYCDTCATHMWTEAESMGNILIFKPGTLDGQEVLDSLPPIKEIYTKYRPVGFPEIPNVEHKKTM